MSDEVPLIPVSRLADYVYCPRLFYLSFVEGLEGQSDELAEGALQHRSLDQPVTDQAEGENAGTPVLRTQALTLSDEALGLIARLDLLEESPGGSVTPVEFKRGVPPDPASAPPERVGPSGNWLNHEVQVCAQALLLEAHGYVVDRGILIYRQAGERREVALTPELRELTRKAIVAARSLAAAGPVPPPLVGDPRCTRCAMAPICLPEETAALAGAPPDGGEIRRIIPARDDDAVLYVNTQGAVVGRDGDCLVARAGGEELCRVPLVNLRHVCVLGQVQVTTAALQACLRLGIPVSHFSQGGYYFGTTHGLPAGHVALRRQQYTRLADPATALVLARQVVWAKVHNQRVLLMRNCEPLPDEVAGKLRRLMDEIQAAGSLDELRGLEGTAAATYFAHFAGMLRADDGATFDFAGRNRRPPRDPVNAMLSLGYGILVRDMAVACWAAGLDPLFGFFHQPRFGRPALALDLMEEFRPVLVDSVVLTAINKRMVGPDDFVRTRSACSLTREGRARFLAAYEWRKRQLVTHPVFGSG